MKRTGGESHEFQPSFIERIHCHGCKIYNKGNNLEKPNNYPFHNVICY